VLELYASNALVYGGNSIDPKHHILYLEDLDQNGQALATGFDIQLRNVLSVLPLNGEMHLAISRMRSPIDVLKVSNDSFLMRVDHKLLYCLNNFLVHTLFIPEVSEFCNLKKVNTIDPTKYEKRNLLDITKDYTFNGDPISFDWSILSYHHPFSIAIAHLVAHEVAHVAHGHLDLLVSEEFRANHKGTEEFQLALRTLEMDADSAATTLTYAGVEQTAQINMDKNNLNTSDKEKAKSFVRRHLVTGTFLTHLLRDTLSSNFAPRSHPISHARFLTSHELLLEVYAKDFGFHAQELLNSCRTSIVSGFSSISGDIKFLRHPIATNTVVMTDAGPVHTYSEFTNNICIAELRPLHQKWSQLRPSLERHFRGGKLAPARYDISGIPL
jgi:hypothetical protein